MKLASYFAVSGIVGILFGLGFLLLPEVSLRQYGIPAEPHNAMQSRYFGSVLLAYGLVPWLGRNLRDDAALRVVLSSGVVAHAIGAALSIWAVTTGLQNQMAWGSVVIYAVLLAGNLYYLSSAARRA